VYVQKNDVAHAREYLQKAVRLRSDYPEALNNLGVLYLLTGQKEEASIVLRECIRVAPNFDQPYLNLSKVYATEGRGQQAQQILRQLLERDPHHPLARKALADLELRR
jgi:Flp pilus assembly protein TadD